jgi:beta-galactosamide-alpha-2,3-sialyltransferase
MSETGRSLCVCLTPLHVLIAKRIAELRGQPFSQGLYLTSADNAKSRYYAEEMRRFCSESEYLVLPGESSYAWPRRLSIWLRRWQYRRSFSRFQSVGTLCVPSSLNHYIYILLSAVQFLELETFDDGLINIQSDSPLALWHTSVTAKCFLLAAGVTYWPERIRSVARRHYSIYDVENLCSRVVRLALIEAGGQSASQTDSRRIRLFLGPAPEAGDKVWNAFVAASRELSPDAYLPHPRELRHELEGVPILDTPMVAEDYIVSRLKADPDIAFEIYGCESSALINLARTPRVTAFSFLDVSASNEASRKLMESSGVVMLAQSLTQPEEGPGEGVHRGGTLGPAASAGENQRPVSLGSGNVSAARY